MNKSFVAITTGIFAAAALCSAPAMAYGRVGFAVSVGVPVPVTYVAPAPAYVAPPVVYGGYGPVVRVGAPYYRGWWDHGHYYYHAYRDGYRGWHR